jgi:hypothetical protein
MLKNTDIKVGNWIGSGVKFEDTSLIGNVLEIGNDDREFEQVWCQCDESFEWFFKDNYCGIPITNDWHILLGGVKNGFNSYEYDISRFESGELKLSFSGDYLIITEFDKDKKIPNDLIVLWNKDIKKEFYVHEFQNLYKSITGKDLVYNIEDVYKKFEKL